jgi:hypothetical protein
MRTAQSRTTRVSKEEGQHFLQGTSLSLKRGGGLFSVKLTRRRVEADGDEGAEGHEGPAGVPDAELLVDAKQHGNDGGDVQQIEADPDAFTDEHAVAEDVTWLVGRDGAELAVADEARVGPSDEVAHLETVPRRRDKMECEATLGLGT